MANGAKRYTTDVAKKNLVLRGRKVGSAREKESKKKGGLGEFKME